MRRTSKLRQGNTVYIATCQYDTELRFFHGTVTACFITGIKTIDGIEYARYKSNEVLDISGYLQRNCSFHPSAGEIHRVYFTRNSARYAIQHYIMLLNHSLIILRTQND